MFLIVRHPCTPRGFQSTSNLASRDLSSIFVTFQDEQVTLTYFDMAWSQVTPRDPPPDGGGCEKKTLPLRCLLLSALCPHWSTSNHASRDLSSIFVTFQDAQVNPKCRVFAG